MSDARPTWMAANAHPSIPDLIESPSSTRPCATRVLARRLRAIAEDLRDRDGCAAFLLNRAAWRLFRCARAGGCRTGWRCGASYCPRCARQIAVRYHGRLTRRMRERARAGMAPHGFALLTLTLAAPNPSKGFRVLQSARGRFLRRRRVRAALAGGEGHVQVEPAIGGDATVWNVHLHALVELKCRIGEVDTASLGAAWSDVLGREGLPGSFDLRQRSNLSVRSLFGAAK